DRGHVLGAGVEGEAQLLLDLAGQPVPVGVVQVHVERLEAAQYRGADPAGRDGADVHALQVVGARDRVGDVAAALVHDPVGRQVVPEQREDHQHHVLGDADAVAVGDLGDGDAVPDGGLQVDVVGADAGGQRERQPGRAGDPLGGEVGGPERLGDDHVGVGELAVEDRVEIGRA